MAIIEPLLDTNDRLLASSSQCGEVFGYDTPEYWWFNEIILVSEFVADATNVAPRLFGSELLGK
jgi:hypothetical protein